MGFIFLGFDFYFGPKISPKSGQKNFENFGSSEWLPDMDSNHDKQIQRLLCYHYTIGQPEPKLGPYWELSLSQEKLCRNLLN